MYRTKRNAVIKRLGASSAVILAVAAAGIGVAAASTHSFSPSPSAASAASVNLTSHDQSSNAAIEGTVSAVTSNLITLTTSSGTVAYALSSSTSITNDGALGAISDLSVGEQVTITPSPSDPTLAAAVAITTSISGAAPTTTLSPSEGTASTVSPAENGDDNNQGVGLALGEDSHGADPVDQGGHGRGHGDGQGHGHGPGDGQASQGQFRSDGHSQGDAGLGVAANATAGLDD